MRQSPEPAQGFGIVRVHPPVDDMFVSDDMQDLLIEITLVADYLQNLRHFRGDMVSLVVDGDDTHGASGSTHIISVRGHRGSHGLPFHPIPIFLDLLLGIWRVQKHHDHKLDLGIAFGAQRIIMLVVVLRAEIRCPTLQTTSLPTMGAFAPLDS